MERDWQVFLLPLAYGAHMVEEFSFGFVAWADWFYGGFGWREMIGGNALFFTLMVVGCTLAYRRPNRYFWMAIAAVLWSLTNVLLHVLGAMRGHSYSPGIVTALAIYVPLGVHLLVRWRARLTRRAVGLGLLVGALGLMWLPSFMRAVLFHADFARMFGVGR